MKASKSQRALQRLYFSKHIPFVLLFGVVIGCTIALGFTVYARVTELRSGIEQGKNDLQNLKQKQQLVAAFTQEQTNLDEDLKLMNRLIPQSQDYFTIIQSLENLSQQTQFQITSYTINLSSSTETKLAIIVRGVGDSGSFVRFLDDYQLNGGRLITIEKVTINPLNPGEVQLNMNFYIESPSDPEADINYNMVLDQLGAIKNKIKYDFAPGQQAAQQDLSFPSKANPF